jgi:hypothetical protein
LLICPACQSQFVLSSGAVIPVAGKTGTGDNRFKVFAPGGRLTGDRVVNRTEAFVFLIGDRFYGTVTAFVPGESGAGYRFTSALAVQILKDLAPQLMPLIENEVPSQAGIGLQPRKVENFRDRNSLIHFQEGLRILNYSSASS